jgi:hypothetical protein
MKNLNPAIPILTFHVAFSCAKSTSGPNSHDVGDAKNEPRISQSGYSNDATHRSLGAARRGRIKFESRLVASIEISM